MPRQVSGMPGFMVHRYGQIDTHAEALAPLASSDRPWPVVIFSPGYGAPRAVYTGLATRLASRGFVVFALDHAYESAVTQLPRYSMPSGIKRPRSRKRRYTGTGSPPRKFSMTMYSMRVPRD